MAICTDCMLHCILVWRMMLTLVTVCERYRSVLCRLCLWSQKGHLVTLKDEKVNMARARQDESELDIDFFLIMNIHYKALEII